MDMPLKIVRNDITTMQVDAIVNAANRTLLGGGGVDGAIHRAAGPRLLAECSLLGGCETGKAKVTKAYRLPCKYVIHTVGPRWRDGSHGEREKLISCYRTSLALAMEKDCETVAFPLISSGIYGYPKDQAFRVAVDTIGEFLMEHEMTVYLVIYDRAAYQISGKLFADVAAYIDDHYVEAHAEPRTLQNRRLEEMMFPRASAPSVYNESAVYGEAGAYGEADASSTADMAPYALDDLLKELDAGFTETLLRLIDRTGKKDSEIYKKANVDRKHFSKIKGNPYYQPSKPTVLAFAIALELDLEETQDLLSRAGFSLSHSSKFDVIVEFFIRQKNYDIFAINEALFHFDQSLLGS